MTLDDIPESRKYLLCPQCGCRRLFIRESDGTEHFIYVLIDKTIVYAKTGEPIPEDLDISLIRCAECSWTGPLHKLVDRFAY